MKLGLSKILQYITSDKLVRMLSPPEHKLELNFCELNDCQVNYLLRCSDYDNFYSFPSCKHEVMYMCVSINISNHALVMKIPTIIKELKCIHQPLINTANFSAHHLSFVMYLLNPWQSQFKFTPTKEKYSNNIQTKIDGNQISVFETPKVKVH